MDKNYGKIGLESEELVKVLQDLAKSFTCSMDEAAQNFYRLSLEGANMSESLMGTLKGHDVYYLGVNEYWENKSFYDGKDCYWNITAKGNDWLIHRGKIIGIIDDRMVTYLQNKDIYEVFPERKEAERKRNLQSLEEALKRGRAAKRGNPTSGKPHTVSERQTVESYMEHSMEILTKGIRYGAEQLRALSAHGDNAAEKIFKASDKKTS